MSSILPGFDYDIFISYRQKDNKYDGWVNEFVANLQKELDATFKEDIAIYFDENPHDGLLETHIVDKSLEEKLKCLIFIPIISRTYVDPKSFAWQHEFVAFNNLAKNDQFGRELKLSHGNVASRILPVKIHDLDPEDKTMLEGELGSVLRPIEFIYKSSGVNRPLKPDDSRIENLNHTYYRDQINKVANAVKEIITGLKNFNALKKDLISEKISSVNIPEVVKSKSFRLKIAIWSFIITGLMVTGYFLWLSFVKTSSRPIDRSIAVLPFENLSNDPEQEYFSDGMMQEIMNHLYKIGELQVTARTSSMKFKKSKKSIKEIAGELKVSYVLEGNVRKYGNKFRINIQLISVKNNQHVVWSENYTRDTTIANILDMQSEVAQQVAISLKTKINPEVRRSIENHATNNKVAYDLYLKGLQEKGLFWKAISIDRINSAIQYFLEAIKQDSKFSMAHTELGKCYWMLAHFSPNPTTSQWLESERALKRAIELDPSNGLAYANYAVVQHNWEWDKTGALESIEKAIRLMPGNIEVRDHAFVYFIRTGECERARNEHEERIKLDPELKIRGDPIWLSLCEGKAGGNSNLSAMVQLKDPDDAYYLVNLYIIEKQYAKAMELAESNFKKDDAFKIYYLTCYGVSAALAGKTDIALNVIKNLNEISAYRNVQNTNFARIYFALGDENTSYAYLEKALADHELWIHDLRISAPFYNHRNDPKLIKIIERSWIPWNNADFQNK